MRLFTDSQDLFVHMRQYFIRNDIQWMKIITYGMWVEITDTGEITPYCKSLQKLLHVLNEKGGSTIIVSNSHSECTPGCPHCERQFEKKINRVAAVAAEFKDINVLSVQECHAKIYLFSDRTVIIGGMNMSNSSWDDVAVHIADPILYDSLLEEYERIKVRATQF